ncbi:hypothetical protein BFS86_11980 [Shewanella algae]|nr:hypothetical protein BFS86_11980 [Shewanella algae]
MPLFKLKLGSEAEKYRIQLRLFALKRFIPERFCLIIANTIENYYRYQLKSLIQIKFLFDGFR